MEAAVLQLEGFISIYPEVWTYDCIGDGDGSNAHKWLVV